MTISMRSAYLIGALCAIFWPAAAVPPTHVEHEQQDIVDPAWIRRAPVDGNVQVVARIGLAQRNLAYGEELLNEISDPDSPKYGKWFSATEVADLFEPSQDTIDAVKLWLRAEGISEEKFALTTTSQWIHVVATIGELESMLNTKYYHFEHAENGEWVIACERYHLPRTVHEHIDFITPGVKIGRAQRHPSKLLHKRSTSSATTHSDHVITRRMSSSADNIMAKPLRKPCNTAATPDCIKKLYNITHTYQSSPGNRLGIYERGGERFDQADLDEFFTRFAPHIKNGTSPVTHGIDGGVAKTAKAKLAGPEVILDLDVAYPLVHSHEIVDYVSGDSMVPPNGYLYTGLGLNDFLDAIDPSYCNYTAYGASGAPVRGVDEPFPDMRKGGYKGTRQCGGYSPPSVISISYGWAEPSCVSQKAYSPMNYQRRQCNEWMKLAMMGVTTVSSSGDFGVGQYPMPPTPGPDCLGKKQNIFNPGYPTNCPYILSVGGTGIRQNSDFKAGNEVASYEFPSGGGFSNIYPTPSYQKSQVRAYLANTKLNFTSYASKYNSSFGANGGVFNRAGRGYPDVSALGDNIVTYLGGRVVINGGTSASAPLWAALLTRINGERLAAGMSTVGYVHPILYRNPQVFNDITEGSNTACLHNTGFKATKGWDPVTGLGTPNYPKLLKLFMNPSSSVSGKRS